MSDIPAKLFVAEGFLPHGDCYLWTPKLIWLHVISDGLIAAAYFSIPVSLSWFMRQRRDFEFRSLVICFATFILACGISHLLEIWNVWHGNYWLSGAVKAVTAAAAIPTAFLLTRFLPRADLSASHAGLERRVAERTRELEAANAELQRQIAARDAADERVRWLASFPEQNPHPIAEFDSASGQRLYSNPAADLLLPDLASAGLDATALRDVRTLLDGWERSQAQMETCEVWIDSRCFLFAVTFNPQTLRVRLYGSDITERRSSELAAARLAAIVESSTDAIIGKNLESVVTSWNAGAEKMFGYRAAEMIGKSITVLIPPDRSEDEERILSRIRRGESIEPFETVRRRQDGRLIDVSISVSPIKNGDGRIIGASKVARDITERKRVEHEREQLAQLIEHSRDFIAMADLTGRLTFMNRGGRQMIGVPDDAQLGDIHFTDYVPEKWHDFFRHTVITTAREQGEWQGEMQLFHMPTGRLIDVTRSTFLLRDAAGEPHCFATVTHDVTEQRSTERTLGEKEALLHASDRRLAEIVHGMTEACFALDGEWRFTFVNERSENLLRHRREEMLGRTMWEVFAKLAGSPAEPHWRRAMAERVPVSFEAFSPTAERWLDVRLFPTGEGLAAFLLDIHDRKEAERAVQDSEERFRTMADSMSQLGWIAQADGFIVWYNQRWYEYTGTTPEQMAGWGWQSVHDPILLPKVMERWKAAIEAGQPYDMEFPLRRSDGEFRSFLTRAQPLKDSAGRVVQWFGTNTDVETLKQAEEKVRQLNEGLEQRVLERTAQLAAANKELEAFSYSVSHDLRAPLRAVDGFSRAVEEDYGTLLPAEGQRYLQTIRQGAQRMGSLIDDLLAFSRLSRLPLQRRTVDTSALVCEVIEDLAVQREGRTIDVRMAELPACWGDPALLKQVWINLVSNAFKYTGKQPAPVVEIGCEEAAGEQIFFVRDNGAGFEMKYVGKLFGVFQRLHRLEDYQGTGVGLAIVQRIVHRHGGRVWAEGAEGRGATFRFTLEKEAES